MSGEGLNGKTSGNKPTKEQIARLEAHFLRLVSNEIESDLTNWEEFYTILQEACNSEDVDTSKNTPETTQSKQG